jgi:glycine C-acetyltransferase
VSQAFLENISTTLNEIEAEGLYKRERLITSPQGGHIAVGGRDVINLCANNYLGLADHPALIAAAKTAMDDHGYGMASVRFICGTQDLHRALETAAGRLPRQGRHDSFRGLFRRQWRVVRAASGSRGRDDLRRAEPCFDHRRHPPVQGAALPLTPIPTWTIWRQLKAARAAGRVTIMIATDGVFSMDGYLAPCRRSRRSRNAIRRDRDGRRLPRHRLHGAEGRGTPHHFGVADKVHILTGTLGKALGGAIGGYIAGPQPVIDLLRQRARPYLFSNALPPCRLRRREAAADGSCRRK